MKKEHFIAAQDGIKTYVLELIPDGEITGDPIFCIHGLTRNHKDFEPIFDFLLGFGRKVYAIDVRGRGNSDYDPNPLNYHPGTYVGDVANIMNVLEIEKAVFIGTSMGGIISMILAAFMPDKVAGIILNDVGPEVNEAGIARIRNYVGNSAPVDNWDDAIKGIKAIAQKEYPLQKDNQQFWQDFAKRISKEENGKISLAYDPEIKQNLQPAKEGEPAPNLWAQFEMIKDIPIGLISGGISDILTQNIIEKMKSIKPNLYNEIIPNVGHAPILDETASKKVFGKILTQQK